MAVVQKWTGVIDGQTYRVIDMGVGVVPRLQVEIRQGNDRMGQARWAEFDPIPTAIFSAMMIAAGVIT